jgi:hypothetical protein
MATPEEFLPYIKIVEDVLRPLVEAAEDFDLAEGLLRDLGYAPPSQVLAFGELSGVANAVAGAIGGLRAAIDADDQDELIKQLAGLVPEVGRAVQALNGFQANIQRNFAGSPLLVQTDILAAIPGKLTEYLIVRFLEDYHPTLFAALLVGGVIDLEDVEETPTLFHLPYRRRSVNWSQLPTLVSDPGGSLKANLDGGDELLYDRLLYLLKQLGLALGLMPIFGAPQPDVLTSLNSGADLSVLDEEGELDTLFFPVIADPTLGAGVEVYPLVDAATGKYTGLALAIRVGAQLEIPLTEAYRLQIEVSANLREGLGVRIPRDGDVSFMSSLFGSPAELAAATTFGIRFSIVPTELGPARKVLSLGAPGGTRFEIGSGSLRFGVEKLDALNLFAEADLKDGLLSLKAGEADGFIAKLLPPEGITGTFTLGVGVSNRAGLYFKGTSGLYIRLPLHLALGPLEIDYLGIGFGFENAQFPLTLTSGFSAQLGPLAAAVEDIGVRGVLTVKPDRSGNLGPLDVSFAFKPPKGVGLSIDASAVKGGGYLYLDPEKGEYAGALELTVSNFLSLKAIGLINTKLPGGQTGFSLLVIITAEFDPGFQLGFGFVLLGVGGLLGLNRTMLLDPLVQGVRTGAVNSILFPTNVVANAPKILSDLRAIFPPREGTFLIGPMAKIGWGTPTLISISVGVIIEIPGNVVLLGRLRVALPTDEEAVLILQVSFVGALEFDKRRIWFFATMYESRVLFITLEGEMGLLTDFSDQPNFVLAVGGFHPRFTAPPLPFPSPARISLSLVNESWARVRADAYFAVTSNTVQMGCHAEAFFGFDAISVEGYFGFDALLRFSPFYLIVEISTGFSVKVFGIGLFGVHLRGSLEGPTPWHVRGSAEIDFFFFSISVDVDVTFGERRTDTLPPIEVLPKIRAEFEKLESWRATPPAGGQLFVSLRELGNAGALVLHPVGTLQISQRFAPLNLPLDKIGNQKPSDVRRVTVAAQAGTLAVKGATHEKFAAAQYREMDDAAKLSAPAFEPLESGVELGAAGRPWATGPLAQRNVRYETIIVDHAFERFRIRFFKFWDGLFTHFRAGAAVSRATVSLASKQRMQPFADKVTVAEDQFTVAFQADNRAYTSTATFTSHAEAQAHMADAMRQDPTLTGEIHVIPDAEVNRAA